MKKTSIFIFIICLVIGLGIAVTLFLNRDHEENTLTLYGNVDVRQVNISFRVAGQVEKLMFEEGDLVKKGELLATLNTSPYVSQSAEAQANLEANKTNLKNAEILLQRRQELIGNYSVSQEDLDDALAKRDSLRAGVIASESALKVAQDNLSYTETYAPNEGIILTRIREPGSVVNPTDPIYTLSLTSPVWVRAYVSEPDLGKVCYGMEAEVFTDTEGAPSYKGKIGFISPVAEFTPKTVQTTQLRTDLVYRLRIYIDNPDGRLKQGMPVTVKTTIPGKPSAEPSSNH
jgi:HlyD family secretion protein